MASSSEDGLIVVADWTKAVDSLGAGPLPVEIDSFGWEATLEALASLGCEPQLRMDWTDPDRPFVTDGGHYTADCKFDSIPDPASLEVEIKQIPGALECGLFVDLARAAIIAGKNGTKAIEAADSTSAVSWSALQLSPWMAAPAAVDRNAAEALLPASDGHPLHAAS